MSSSSSSKHTLNTEEPAKKAPCQPRALIFLFDGYQVFAERTLFPAAFDRLFDYANSANEDTVCTIYNSGPRCTPHPEREALFQDMVRVMLGVAPRNTKDPGAWAYTDENKVLFFGDGAPKASFYKVKLDQAKPMGCCIPCGYAIRVLQVSTEAHHAPSEGTR
jgi:hypothetical protein